MGISYLLQSSSSETAEQPHRHRSQMELPRRFVTSGRCMLAFLLMCAWIPVAHAWIVPSGLSSLLPRSIGGRRQCPKSTLTYDSSIYSTTNLAMDASTTDEDEDDDFEYVEYEILTEREFMGSEWLVGTVMDSRPNNIAETWVRLATDRDGKNVAIWGDGSQGKWSLDVANQFLSMSKENIFGKNIWAGVVDDYYFTLGTVRGWSIISPAEVKGQWQARRLGVDPKEAGTAPWFETTTEDDKDDVVVPPTTTKEVEETPKIEAKAEEPVEAVPAETAETSKD